MIGNTIGGYEILEKRGEGGMGMFFKARDCRLDRLVGLKTIRAELLHEPEILAKLEEEAKSLARLDHPNIARLLHYMVIDNQRYIVMEYVEGEDLAEKLRREGPFAPELLALIVPQICAAIGYAHNRKVIHRDIKPSNILLTADKTVKVTDFGIAKVLGVSAKTKTGVATGSLPYMAPEQIRGQAVDPRTDIYQLGVMLFELLTGRRPFLAETEYDMMSHHLSTPPPVPSSINPEIPRTVDAVVLKAMAKDPAQRYESASDFANAFKGGIAGGDDSRTVYHVDSGARMPRKSGRRPLIGALVIGILAIAAFVKVFWFSGKEELQKAAAPAQLEVILHASLPTDVAPSRISSQRLLITHPSAGTIENDSLRLVGDSFEGVLALPPADSIRLILSGYDTVGKEVVRGQRWLRSKGQSSIQTDLRLLSLLPEVAQGDDKTHLDHSPRVDTVTSKPPDRPAPPVVSSSANLTIDVQPFSERERIQAIWIDDRKQSGGLPLKVDATPGMRMVRWQIGDDRWTDSVTVGEIPIEKNLIFELSHGRVNVAVTFPDGPGYAEIWLDGRETGQGTPAELRDVPAGPHEITLRREGYRMQGGPHIVRVSANDRTRVSIPMAPR